MPFHSYPFACIRRVELDSGPQVSVVAVEALSVAVEALSVVSVEALSVAVEALSVVVEALLVTVSGCRVRVVAPASPCGHAPGVLLPPTTPALSCRGRRDGPPQSAVLFAAIQRNLASCALAPSLLTPFG